MPWFNCNIDELYSTIHVCAWKGSQTSLFSTTFVLDFTLKHAPPSSCNARLTMPAPCCTTRRLPLESNCSERGFVRPVTTKAIWYPDATVGLIEFVGVRVVEQEDAAWENERKPHRSNKYRKNGIRSMFSVVMNW